MKLQEYLARFLPVPYQKPPVFVASLTAGFDHKKDALFGLSILDRDNISNYWIKQSDLMQGLEKTDVAAVTEYTHITREQYEAEGLPKEEVFAKIAEVHKTKMFVAHNAAFIRRFVDRQVWPAMDFLDTCILSQAIAGGYMFPCDPCVTCQELVNFIDPKQGGRGFSLGNLYSALENQDSKLPQGMYGNLKRMKAVYYDLLQQEVMVLPESAKKAQRKL